MGPVASIIIATYNHAAYLREAIDSALAQTLPCEVVVIDDGSSDAGETDRILLGYGDAIRWMSTPHRGASAARNKGLALAIGEYVMFLDADDLIVPTKIAKQIAAFDRDVGWVLCDVRIDDAAKGRSELASTRYDYRRKEIGGWIAPLLEPANFIPIMAPLVRRSVLEAIQFYDTVDGTPEDWRFWQRVAKVARVRYLPEELATYRKQRTGRNRLPKAGRAIEPNITLPLRLNLGCGTPGTRSWHPIEGFVNLDKSLDWRFEDGLTQFPDHAVAGITISHALMYLPLEHWPAFFREVTRVLVPGGVIRITEDHTTDPLSQRFGGWTGSDPAVTLTFPSMIADALERAGLLAVHLMSAADSRYADLSLCQAQHGAPPDVFFIEGVKMNGVLFAPHNDDETLFAAFLILKYRPRVVVCYASAGDYGDPAVREAETRDAMSVLGAGQVHQWAGGDLEAQMRAFDAEVHPACVWAPHELASHPEHVAVHHAARRVFGARVRTYHTYRAHPETGLPTKVRHGDAVTFEPEWISHKLRALARYESQIRHPRANQFFCQDLLEYVGEDGQL